MQSTEIKTKIVVNKEFIEDLIIKSWQEIDSLQSQIELVNYESPDGVAVRQLLKNLLTSFYIFVGGLENIVAKANIAEIVLSGESTDQEDTAVTIYSPTDTNTDTKMEFEPFEYFVDFDEPVGKSISDDDLQVLLR